MGWLQNDVTDAIVTLGGLAIALIALGTLYATVRRTRLGRAVGHAWQRAVVLPRDERRAHVIRAVILPDLDDVRNDAREAVDELRQDVTRVIDQHTIEEMKGVRAQTETIRAVQAMAEASVQLAKANAARIEDVARTVGAARTTIPEA